MNVEPLCISYYKLGFLQYFFLRTSAWISISLLWMKVLFLWITFLLLLVVLRWLIYSLFYTSIGVPKIITLLLPQFCHFLLEWDLWVYLFPSYSCFAFLVARLLKAFQLFPFIEDDFPWQTMQWSRSTSAGPFAGLGEGHFKDFIVKETMCERKNSMWKNSSVLYISLFLIYRKISKA